MSQRGINLAAGIFQQMQLGREKIMLRATEGGKCDKQDILLSRLFEKANDAVKDDFANIVAGKYPDGKTKI